MKLLVLGADGRTHALVWKLFNSPHVRELICAPGNGGTGQIAPTVELDVGDSAAVARWSFDEGIDLIIPAESGPLQRGLVDEVVSFQIGVCGPSQRSTMLEHSRCQAKEFMLRHNLPTAPGRTFTDLATAEKFLASQTLPVVIKADHSAGGEGVYHDRHAALNGMRDLFAQRTLEESTAGVVIEGYLSGPRVALSAFTDGRTAVPLLAARLYDRVEPNEAGLQAHGVGAHTGTSRFATLLTEHLLQKFLQPIVAGLAQEGLPFWGILGIDCIITAAGPRLTAIRCTLREGEAQVVLPRLEDDLLSWIQAMIAQRLHDMPAPQWSPLATVGIGLFGRGYPHHFSVGGVISGVEDLDTGVLVFHSATEQPAGMHYTSRSGSSGSLFGLLGAGTLSGLLGGAPSNGALRTTGGQPLMVVARAATLAEAQRLAVTNAERILFEGSTYRPDIGTTDFR